MPGRHDPEAFARADGLELPLCQGHPVGVFEPIDRGGGHVDPRGFKRGIDVGVRAEERRHHASLPAGGVPVRLAEDLALARAARVGVGKIHRDRAASRELVAHVLRVAAGDHQRHALPRHQIDFSAAIFSSR